MKRNAIYLIALAALTSAASLATAADDPESKAAVAVDGKTIVIQSGGGGGGFGTFQPARSLRLNLQPATRKLAGPEAAEAESPALMASALEFLLEGLHLTKRLNKDASGARALYRGRK